jgi:hypothetical protein
MKNEIEEHVKLIGAVNKSRQENLEIDVANMNK